MYLLLGTQGCHLCELAEQIINESRIVRTDFFFKIIDIAEQTQWQADFATLIPVLLHVKTHHFLNWPFTQDDVLTFIHQNHD